MRRLKKFFKEIFGKNHCKGNFSGRGKTDLLKLNKASVSYYHNARSAGLKLFVGLDWIGYGCLWLLQYGYFTFIHQTLAVVGKKRCHVRSPHSSPVGLLVMHVVGANT